MCVCARARIYMGVLCVCDVNSCRSKSNTYRLIVVIYDAIFSAVIYWLLHALGAGYVTSLGSDDRRLCVTLFTARF